MRLRLELPYLTSMTLSLIQMMLFSIYQKQMTTHMIGVSGWRCSALRANAAVCSGYSRERACHSPPLSSRMIRLVRRITYTCLGLYSYNDFSEICMYHSLLLALLGVTYILIGLVKTKQKNLSLFMNMGPAVIGIIKGK